MKNMNRRKFIKGLLKVGALFILPATWIYRKAKPIIIGKRAVLYIDGVEVVMCNDVTYSIESDIEPIHVLGQFEVSEIDPDIKATITMTRMTKEEVE